ncbi:MAG: MFS transporter [Amylibacter sp.]
MDTNKKFYGWTLLAVMFSVYFIASMVTYGGSVAASHMAKTTGMSGTLFGVGFTINFIAAGFGGTVAAIMAAYIGERKVISIGMVVVTIGCLVMYAAGETPVGYIVAFGFFVGGGATFATFVPMQTMITRWFVKRRALATGIVMSSGGFAGAIVSPLANFIIEESGDWRTFWIFISILSFASIFIGYRWIRNAPQDVGQFPDGDTPESIAYDQSDAPAHAKMPPSSVYRTTYDWSLRELLKVSTLWHMIILSILSGAATFMVLANGVVHLLDRGLDGNIAALSLGIVTFASIGGRLLAGILGDRFEPRYLLMIALLLQTIGISFIVQADNIWYVYIYAGLTGLGFGMGLVSQFTMMGNFFGPTYFKNILGFMMPITTLGAAMSPLIAGIVRDSTGSYEYPFMAAVVCAALAGIGTIFLRPPVKADAEVATS